MNSNKNHKRVFILKDTVIFQLSEQKSNPRSMMKENVSYRQVMCDGYWLWVWKILRVLQTYLENL